MDGQLIVILFALPVCTADWIIPPRRVPDPRRDVYGQMGVLLTADTMSPNSLSSNYLLSNYLLSNNARTPLAVLFPLNHANQRVELLGYQVDKVIRCYNADQRPIVIHDGYPSNGLPFHLLNEIAQLPIFVYC